MRTLSFLITAFLLGCGAELRLAESDKPLYEGDASRAELAIRDDQGIAFLRGGEQSGLKGLRGRFQTDEELRPEVWVIRDRGHSIFCRVEENCQAGMVLWTMFVPVYCWASDGQLDLSESGELSGWLEFGREEESFGSGCSYDLLVQRSSLAEVDWEGLQTEIDGHLGNDPEGFWQRLAAAGR